MVKKRKKLVFYIFFFVLSLFISLSNVSAAYEWEGNISGRDASTTKGACSDSSACFCNWNNMNFAAASVEIGYYVNGVLTVAISNSPVIVGNGSDGWIKTYISQSYKRWDKFPSTFNGFAGEIQNLLLDASGDYANMRTLFSLVLSGNSSYTYDSVKQKIENKEWINGGLGSRNGVRVIIKPVFTIQTNNDKCGFNGQSFIVSGSIQGIANAMNSLKNQYGSYYGLTDKGAKYEHPYLADYHYRNLSTYIYYSGIDDIYPGESTNESQASTANRVKTNYEATGWGKGLFAPFGSTPPPPGGKCNPDTNGVKYCCETKNITSTNSTNNNLTQLTRRLTANEIATYCNDPIVKTCHYNSVVTTDAIPTRCTTGTNSGYIGDTTDWTCIFDSSSNANPNVRTQFVYSTSNKYCHIYCRQEITAELPSSAIATYQGKYMTVGTNNSGITSISPITYTGKKECRVTNLRGRSGNSSLDGIIDKDLFLSDLANADANISAYWDNYQNAYGNWQAMENASGNCKVTDDQFACMDSLDPTPEQQSSCSSDASSWASGEVTKHFKNNPDDTRSESEIFDIKYNEYYDFCIGKISNTCGADRWYKEYTCYGGYTNGVYGYFNGDFKYNDRDNNKDSQVAGAHGTANSAYNTYASAVTARDNIINTYNNCTTVATNINYDEFNPKIDFKYDEPVYGNFNSAAWNLKDKLNYLTKSVIYYLGGNARLGTYTSATSNINSGLTDNVVVTSCGADGYRCGTTTASYYKTTWWESDIVKSYDYSLKDGIYRYVEKGSGQSVHVKSNPSSQYNDIGYSNLPVHYSTNPGRYNYDINVTTYGHNNKLDKYISTYGNYDCSYSVSCMNIISFKTCNIYYNKCPNTNNRDVCAKPTGLNVIYRTISLYSKRHAFPGLAGSGRTPGDNWNDDSLINTYIVNNRGVKDYNVYKLDPLYEIELTPGLMKKFRDYNNKMNKDVTTLYRGTSAEVTGITGYTGFENFVCNSDGTKCKSNLLRGNVTGYNAIKVTGCAINGSGTYRNCGSNNQAW